MRAATIVGGGPYSQIIEVTTLQDGMYTPYHVIVYIFPIVYFLVPSAAPSDLSVTYVLSTTIELMWGEVPENNRNGIITEYSIRFRQLTFETNWLCLPSTSQLN